MNERETPRWFQLGDELLWPTLELAYAIMQERSGLPVNLIATPQLGAVHLLQCIDTSTKVNLEGRHAISLGLLRQCVESLGVVELGLLPASYSEPILEDWRKGRLKAGGIRKRLENDVWPRYGAGLWSESWGDFFGELAQAVQPYAHYGPELQEWQLAVMEGEKPRLTAEGNYLVLSRVGLRTYDPSKATRITLLHCLICWVVGRLIIANGGDTRLNATGISDLGREIAGCDLLGGGRLKWHQEFWPFLFDGPLPKP